MDGCGAATGQRRTMLGTRISLVALKVERREVLGFGGHDPVTGHLGHYRGSGNGQADGVTAHHGAHVATANEIPVAVHQNHVGHHAESFNGPTRRQPLGCGHPQLIALGVAGVTDRPCLRPCRDGVIERLTLSGGEHLGIPHPGDATISRGHHRSKGEWSRPRTPAHLIDASHHPIPLRPQLALHAQPRGLAPKRGAESCTSARSHRPHATATAQQVREAVARPGRSPVVHWHRHFRL